MHLWSREVTRAPWGPARPFSRLPVPLVGPPGPQRAIYGLSHCSVERVETVSEQQECLNVGPLWRQGSHAPRNLWVEDGSGPDGRGRAVGRMDTPELAAHVVACVNFCLASQESIRSTLATADSRWDDETGDGPSCPLG